MQVQAFTWLVRNYSEWYSEGRRHMMFAMGGDFHYEAAAHNFKNLDKLIAYMNEATEETGIHLLYSTPSCYAKALNKDGDGADVEEWRTKTDDFFPYCDEGSAHTSNLIKS